MNSLQGMVAKDIWVEEYLEFELQNIFFTLASFLGSMTDLSFVEWHAFCMQFEVVKF